MDSDNYVKEAFNVFGAQLAGGAAIALPFSLAAVILAPAYFSIGFVVMLFLNGKIVGLRCSPEWYRRRRSRLQSRMSFEGVRGEVRMNRLKLMGWWSLGLLCWPPILVMMLLEAIYRLELRCGEKIVQCWRGRQATENKSSVEIRGVDV